MEDYRQGGPHAPGHGDRQDDLRLLWRGPLPVDPDGHALPLAKFEGESVEVDPQGDSQRHTEGEQGIGDGHVVEDVEITDLGFGQEFEELVDDFFWSVVATMGVEELDHHDTILLEEASAVVILRGSLACMVVLAHDL